MFFIVDQENTNVEKAIEQKPCPQRHSLCCRVWWPKGCETNHARQQLHIFNVEKNYVANLLPPLIMCVSKLDDDARVGQDPPSSANS